jgi:hypothetical protein
MLAREFRFRGRTALYKGRTSISRAQAEERTAAKLVGPGFMADIRPPLSLDQLLTEGAIRRAFAAVFVTPISVMPGAFRANV